jgi:hypothetical protein
MWQSGTVGEYKYSVLGHILVVLMLIIASLCDHEIFRQNLPWTVGVATQ